MFYVYCLHQDIQIQINFLNNVAYIQIYVYYSIYQTSNSTWCYFILFYFKLFNLLYSVYICLYKSLWNDNYELKKFRWKRQPSYCIFLSQLFFILTHLYCLQSFGWFWCMYSDARYWTPIISEKSRNNRSKDDRKIPQTVIAMSQKLQRSARSSVWKVMPNVHDWNWRKNCPGGLE